MKELTEEYIYQGRIAICSPSEVGGKYHQYRLSGVLICPDGQPKISESMDWEGIQCEVIIRPIKRMGNPKIKGQRLDTVAQCLSMEDEWIKSKKK